MIWQCKHKYRDMSAVQTLHSNQLRQLHTHAGWTNMSILLHAPMHHRIQKIKVILKQIFIFKQRIIGWRQYSSCLSHSVVEKLKNIKILFLNILGMAWLWQICGLAKTLNFCHWSLQWFCECLQNLKSQIGARKWSLIVLCTPSKKIWDYLGIFPKRRTPPPPPFGNFDHFLP